MRRHAVAIASATARRVNEYFLPTAGGISELPLVATVHPAVTPRRTPCRLPRWRRSGPAQHMHRLPAGTRARQRGRLS